MIDFCRDGWEGEPKRTINAFTFQVNINTTTSLGTIFLIIVVITSFVLSINMILYLAPRDFPLPCPRPWGIPQASGCINPAFDVLAILIALLLLFPDTFQGMV